MPKTSKKLALTRETLRTSGEEVVEVDPGATVACRPVSPLQLSPRPAPRDRGHRPPPSFRRSRARP